MDNEKKEVDDGSTWGTGIFAPLNVIILAGLLLVFYMLYRRRREQQLQARRRPLILSPMEKRDFRLSELREFDGVRNPRILFAVDGIVFDVSRGRGFYGPDGPYGSLAGHDASRALATMNIDAVSDTWDDLTDLSATDREAMNDWRDNFRFKYDEIGKLLKDDAPSSGDTENRPATEQVETESKKEI